MIKKVLLAGLTATMALSITACGDSKGQDKKQENEVRETVIQQEETNIPEIVNEDEVYIDSEDESYFIEEICYMYNDYLLGNMTEEELGEIEEIYGVSIEEAEEIFKEYAEEFGYNESLEIAEIPHFEATEEIKNATFLQYKMQVADMVLGQFTRVSDCMEQVENSAMPFTYEYNPDALVTGGSKQGSIDVYLNNELYMKLYVGNPPRGLDKKETRPLKDCIVYFISMLDYSDVYYAKGIPALNSGITKDEYDALIQADFNDELERSESSGSSSYSITYVYGFLQMLKQHFDYMLECDGASIEVYHFCYRAQFDATGQSLEKLTIEQNPALDFQWNNFDIADNDVIIDR